MRIATTLITSLTLLLIPSAITSAADRPNVLMIMVDDLGFSDVGCYGSEIETPNLDALAGRGLRFSQFYNTAKCHSSRVSLLSGQYCIAAGDTALSHTVTSAEVLRDSGYFTAMTGKWHLKQQPTDFGFDRYFGHLSGACNYFRGDDTFRLNGDKWEVPPQDFYTTVANVDFALQFLDEARESGKPWHLYVAFNAPHAPLQALPQDYAKYQGRYEAGWDRIRQSRAAKQAELGLLPADCQPSPRPEHIPAWNSLSEARKRFEVKRMTTLAAMIDRVDQEIGRLVADLKEAGELDNTLICFVSDNGACPYDRRSNKLDALPTDGTVTWSDSTGWAWARNSPFRYYKQNQFEGGICTPAIVHWPAGIERDAGSIVRQPAHLIDIMPTFADVTDSKIPTEYPGRSLRPVSGQSLRPLFKGETIQREQPLHFLFASDRGLRLGDWKIVSFRSEAWELYNLAEDRTERIDLAEREPERVESMAQQWTRMARELLHAPDRAYAPVGPAKLPHRHPEWTNFDADPSESGRGNQANANTRSPKAGKAIRARKNTKLEIADDELRLEFSGEDSGLAFDRLPETLPAGPYKLAFQLQRRADGGGEVFFTTDAKTSLPNGIHVVFEPGSERQWHEHAIRLDTSLRIHKLRLDVGEGSGTAAIKDLRLLDDEGQILLRWPAGTR